MSRMTLTHLAGGLAAIAIVSTAALPAAGRAWGPAEGLAEPAESAGPFMCEPAMSGDEAWPAPDPVMVRLFVGVLLSAQETALGIRPDQQEAWRAYTAALIAFLPTGEGIERWADPEKRAKAGAFDLADDVAGIALARAPKAQALRDATARLKAVLTPEQTETARRMQQRLVERVLHLVEWRHGMDFGAPL